MINLGRYFEIVDLLCESRRSPEWNAENDRPLLALLQDWYLELSEEDQVEVEKQGWRGSPALVDRRARTALVQRVVDAADGTTTTLPREQAA